MTTTLLNVFFILLHLNCKVVHALSNLQALFFDERKWESKEVHQSLQTVQWTAADDIGFVYFNFKLHKEHCVLFRSFLFSFSFSYSLSCLTILLLKKREMSEKNAKHLHSRYVQSNDTVTSEEQLNELQKNLNTYIYHPQGMLSFKRKWLGLQAYTYSILLLSI